MREGLLGSLALGGYWAVTFVYKPTGCTALFLSRFIWIHQCPQGKSSFESWVYCSGFSMTLPSKFPTILLSL